MLNLIGSESVKSILVPKIDVVQIIIIINFTSDPNFELVCDTIFPLFFVNLNQ